MIMGNVVFWDVDTQIDFMEPDGKLYVPGAEDLRANLGYLTGLGAERARLYGSVDAHLPDDPEFIDWPEHCVYGTPGQRKVFETLVEGTLFVPSAKLTDKQVSEVLDYKGQVIFEKQDNDVRTNLNVRHFMEVVKPSFVVLYGVVSEICVNQAVKFLAGDLGYATAVVSDAIKELDISKENVCKADWKKLGVKILKTSNVKRAHKL
jgi:nicotinamidase/pyrazinamidase